MERSDLMAQSHVLEFEGSARAEGRALTGEK